MSKRPKTGFTGQSLAEYGLGIALVGIVCIGALAVMGSQLGTVVSDAGSHMAGGTTSGSATKVTGSPSLNGTVIPGAQIVQLTTASGTKLEINYPTDLATTIETAGANGTTSLLIANLESITKQLADAGELDVNQVNLLTQLANQGHTIASVQKLIEDEGKKIAQDPTHQFSVTYNGKIYTNASDLSTETFDNTLDAYNFSPQDLLNVSDQSIKKLSDDPALNQDSEAVKFVALLQEAESSGALQNPGVRELIPILVHDILKISGEFGTIIYKEGNQSLPQLKERLASQQTDSKSATICNTGGSQDTGIYCP